ncbi:MAG: HAD family hydrolase [Candidatus Eremiobacteraeota bacterium]|nr:HAD family hydrolase [Candidatus Eremiobacteraeota bacterium]MBV9056831.1 HAD family hydrolase [Candidatus Eremiobacteraeota bacterium]MBV9700430.1 HAD family hydrolase [Candidatus Eremiobacteraeota bacterium]
MSLPFRRLDAILFDLDDTLHDDTFANQSAAHEVAREIAAEHGIDALELKDAYIAQAEGFWERLAGSDLKAKLANLRATLWQAALDSVGAGEVPDLAKRSAARYHAYRAKYYTVFPGAVELLRELRERGVKLGILTNGFSETHREKIALLRLTELFDAIFLADEVGMVKPDPLLFAHACRALGTSPSHAAMVGDRYERDVRGALDAGLFTIWLNVRDERLPPGAQPPDATCGSIGDVGRILLQPAGVS